jgi:hypothetical protein
MRGVMTSLRTRNRAATPIAAGLLVLQVLAGAAVPLAHAAEPQTAPGAIEAHHDASCVVIHDAMRCALCLYFSSLTTPPPAVRAGVSASTPARLAPLAVAAGMRSPTFADSQPRAPPIQLS